MGLLSSKYSCGILILINFKIFSFSSCKEPTFLCLQTTSVVMCVTFTCSKAQKNKRYEQAPQEWKLNIDNWD